jgi:hypothetical protein
VACIIDTIGSRLPEEIVPIVVGNMPHEEMGMQALALEAKRDFLPNCGPEPASTSE